MKLEGWKGGDCELGLSVYDEDSSGLRCWLWRKQEESNTSRSLGSQNGGRRRRRRAQILVKQKRENNDKILIFFNFCFFFKKIEFEEKFKFA